MIDFAVANDRLVRAQQQYSDAIKDVREGHGAYHLIQPSVAGEIAARVETLGTIADQADALQKACYELAMAVAVMDHVTNKGEHLLSCFREESDGNLFTDDERQKMGLLFAYAYLGRLNDLAQRVDSTAIPDDLRARLPRTVEASRAYRGSSDEMKAATQLWCRYSRDE